MVLLPFVVSLAVSGLLIYFDQALQGVLPGFLSIILKYVAPLLLSIFTYYTTPWLIYKIVQVEGHERKSSKEESYMTKNTILMIFNSLILPYIMATIISHLNAEEEIVHEIPIIPKWPKDVIK